MRGAGRRVTTKPAALFGATGLIWRSGRASGGEEEHLALTAGADRGSGEAEAQDHRRPGAGFRHRRAGHPETVLRRIHRRRGVIDFHPVRGRPGAGVDLVRPGLDVARCDRVAGAVVGDAEGRGWVGRGDQRVLVLDDDPGQGLQRDGVLADGRPLVRQAGQGPVGGDVGFSSGNALGNSAVSCVSRKSPKAVRPSVTV